MMLDFNERGKEIRRTGIEVAAWVLTDRTVEGRQMLQEVHWRCQYSLIRSGFCAIFSIKGKE